MDRNNLIGFLLIGVVITVYMVFVSINKEPIQNTKSNKDSLELTSEQYKTNLDSNNYGTLAGDSLVITDSLIAVNRFGSIFATNSIGEEKIITINTDLVVAKISSKGGAILEWELKNYDGYDTSAVQLIAPLKGNFFPVFYSIEGKKIDLRDLYLSFEGINNDNVVLTGEDSLKFRAVLDIGGGRKIIREYTFFGDKYHFDATIETIKFDGIIPQQRYNIVWEKGILYQEKDKADEATEAKALVVFNQDIEELVADEDFKVERSVTGTIDYASVKVKYFTATIIPKGFDGTVDMTGERLFSKKYETNLGHYDLAFRIPYSGGNRKDEFKVFIGPLKYDIVSDYGIDRTVNYGWGPIRYIGQYFMVPIFQAVHFAVPNYGIAIILFALLMKILLYPLSIKQMKMSQKMKLLAPEVEKVREKYKDDTQKQQMELMNIYSSYGVNPAGGCLPLLLQMPILYALWTVLRNNIELRQADFIFWITDLSQPDSLFDFGFSFLGMSSVSGLAVAMALTMFVQQKQTITDPRQKALLYIMPLMFLFMFSNFPAGLNLYYFMYNLFSILHQYWINNHSKNTLTLEEMKKAPKKESWMQKKMKEAQQLAEAQGRTPPGFTTNAGKPINQNKKSTPKKKR